MGSDIMEKFAPLPSLKYSIIYADPPWDYKGGRQHSGAQGEDTGGASEHYPTVTTRDLFDLDIPSICEKDALLFMWTSSPHLDQAIELMRAWGFSYKTIAFVWDKVRVNPGYYTMSQCEICIVGKRGKIPTPRGARNVRQFLSQERGAHSAKPEEVRKRIEEMFPHHRRIEIFARETAQWWDSWGNEV